MEQLYEPCRALPIQFVNWDGKNILLIFSIAGIASIDKHRSITPSNLKSQPLLHVNARHYVVLHMWTRQLTITLHTFWQQAGINIPM